MTFRSASSPPVHTSSLSGGLTLNAPAGYASGDKLLAFLSTDAATGENANITFAGWTFVDEVFTAADGQSLILYQRNATGSDNFALSTTTAGCQCTGWVMALSGRDNAAAITVVKTVVWGFLIAGSGTPPTATVTLTGLTAAAGDDIVSAIAVDQQTQSDTFAFANPTAGYTERVDFASGDWDSVGAWTRENVTAGATGNFSVEMTRTGAGQFAAVGMVVAVPQASGSDTTPPTLTGTVTASSITSTSATVSWPTGSDNVAVTSYERRVNAGTWVDVGNTTSVGLTSLTPSTSYTVDVRAKDAAGNVSTPAISVTFTTSASSSGTLQLSTLKLRRFVGGTASFAYESGVSYRVQVYADGLTLGSAIYTGSAASTNSTGQLADITDAAFTAGTVYKLALTNQSTSETTVTELTAV